jgi:hypothetical protein
MTFGPYQLKDWLALSTDPKTNEGGLPAPLRFPTSLRRSPEGKRSMSVATLRAIP